MPAPLQTVLRRTVYLGRDNSIALTLEGYDPIKDETVDLLWASVTRLRFDLEGVGTLLDTTELDGPLVYLRPDERRIYASFGVFPGIRIGSYPLHLVAWQGPGDPTGTQLLHKSNELYRVELDVVYP